MFYRTVRRVLAEYQAWADDRGLVPDGDATRWRSRIQVLIEGRGDYLGKRDPTYWRGGDVHELLIQHCAPRQVDAWDLTTRAPREFGDFLRFLDETGLLHPGSTRVPTLLKELDRLTPKFAASMADKSRWRLAKRVLTAMLSDDVDLDDDDAVDAWAAKFNTLEASARRPVLGELMDDEPEFGTGIVVVHDGQVAVLRADQVACKHRMWPDARCVCGRCPGDEYPAICLRGDGELAQAVAGYGSGLLRKLAELADWIGAPGRQVDNHGELMRDAVRGAALAFGLTPADARRMHDLPGLKRLWRLSLDLGILELRRGLAVPGPSSGVLDRALRGEGSPDEALALWSELFDEVSAPIQEGGDRDEATLREWMARWPPRFFGHLYALSSAGEQVDFGEIMDGLMTDLADQIPRADSAYFAAVASNTVRLTLSQASEHGAVEVSGEATERAAPPAEIVAALRGSGLELWAFDQRADLRVRLTELGKYAMRRQLLAAGGAAPLAG